MKNRIRLTESDLHKIVKESVNRMLTELDWKTYASAAEKSANRFKIPISTRKNRETGKDGCKITKTQSASRAH